MESQASNENHYQPGKACFDNVVRSAIDGLAVAVALRGRCYGNLYLLWPAPTAHRLRRELLQTIWCVVCRLKRLGLSVQSEDRAGHMVQGLRHWGICQQSCQGCTGCFSSWRDQLKILVNDRMGFCWDCAGSCIRAIKNGIDLVAFRFEHPFS